MLEKLQLAEPWRIHALAEIVRVDGGTPRRTGMIQRTGTW
jgi:hypothetical protein